MLIKLLGIMDLASALMLLLLQYEVIGWRLAFSFAVYLMVKGYAFKSWFISWIDFVIGLYFFVLFLGFTPFLSYLFAAYLGYKGIMSLF